MSDQLQSFKYFDQLPGSEQAPVVSPVSASPAEATSPYASPNPVATNVTVDSDQSQGVWTGTMSVISGFISFAGGLGVIQEGWSIWSLFKMEENIQAIEQLSQRMPQLKDSVALMQGQLANWNLLMVMSVFSFIVSVGFLVSSYMYSKRRENGHMMMAGFCGLAILLNLVAIYVSYITFSDMPILQANNGVAIATAAASVVVGFKIMIYLGIMIHSFNKNAKAIFTQTQPQPALADAAS